MSYEMKSKNYIHTNVLAGAVIGFSSNNNDFDSIKDEVVSIAKDAFSENNPKKIRRQ